MRRGRRQRLPNWLLGLFVLIAIPVLFWSAFHHRLPFGLDSIVGPSKHRFQIAFRAADGVVPGVSPVRIAGVTVGEVTGVESGPDDSALVTVEVGDQALPLHSDARAQVRPRTFLEGNYFVDIHTGSPASPVLPDGGSIPLNQTASSVRFDQILGTFTHDIRDRFRTTVHELGGAVDGEVARSLRRATPHLAPTFSDFAVSAEATRGLRPHDLSGAIRSTARVAAAVQRRRPQLDRLVSSFATVAAALADHDRDLEAIFARLPGVLTQGRGALTALNAALPQTRALVIELRPGLRAAPPALRLALPFTEQANALLAPRELPALIDDLRPTSRDLAASAPDLTRAFRGLRPTSRCLLGAVVPALFAEVPDGALSTGDPAYEDLAHGLVGLSSASQNFDGNGYNLRYQAGFNDELFTFEPGSPLDPLLALGGEDIAGARPASGQTPPPLRPGVPCTQSGAPDLSARTAPSDLRPTGARLGMRVSDRVQMRQVLRRLEAALRRRAP